MKDEELNKKDATVNPQTDPEQIEKEVTVGSELVEGEVVDGSDVCSSDLYDGKLFLAVLDVGDY